MLAFQTYVQIWWALPANFIPDASMPLHICDVVIWLAPFALIWRRRWACTLLYFWGVGLSIAAFFYPTITEGPARIEFWLYWIGHVQIVGTGVYVAAVIGYRPQFADVCLATAALVVYSAVVLPIDVLLDLDYGYLGPHSKIMARLGPWPWRVVWLFALQTLVFVVLWLGPRRARRRAAESPNRA